MNRISITIASIVLSTVFFNSGCSTTSGTTHHRDASERVSSSTHSKQHATNKTGSPLATAINDVLLTLFVDITMEQLFSGLSTESQTDHAPGTPQITRTTDR